MSNINKWFAGEDFQGTFIGVVESRQDPLELGRVQVRVYGVHNPNLTEIPSINLPWATVIADTSGKAFSTPKESDLVFGFWLDGAKQVPLVIGVIPGIESNPPSTGSGFHDLRDQATIAQAPKIPVGRVYNTDGSGIIIAEANTANSAVLESLRHPNVVELNQPTTPAVARYDTANTVIAARKANLDKNIPTANGGVWSEPYPAYNPLYPYNNATQTESGHLFELDDTPGSERVHVAHRTGSFVEWFPTGTRVQKVTKSNYSITMADEYVHIMGRCFITVDSDANILVKGDVNLEVGGTLGANVAGDANFSVGGDFNVSATNINLAASEDATVISDTIHLTGSESLDIIADATSIESGGDLNFMGGGNMNMQGSSINILASGTAAMQGTTVGISGVVGINGLASVNKGPVSTPGSASGASSGTAKGLPGAISGLTKNTGEASPEEVPVPINVDVTKLDAVTGVAYVQSQFLTQGANNTMVAPDSSNTSIPTQPCMYDPTSKTFLASSAWAISQNGLALIQSFEGFAKVTAPDTATAYPDPATGAQPYTIGYGSTSVAIDQPVTLGEMISRATAQEYLTYAITTKFLPVLQKGVSVQLTQNMVDACLSFIYNVGPNNFLKSTFRARINQQQWCAAGDALLVWNKAAGQVLPGLTARRTKERALFLS